MRRYSVMEWGKGAVLGYGCRLYHDRLDVDLLTVTRPLKAGTRVVRLYNDDGSAGERVKVYFEATKDIGYLTPSFPRR